MQSKWRSHLQPQPPHPPLGVRSHRDGLTIVDVHGKSVERTQDIPVDRFKNIRLCLANTLFVYPGCTACLKGGELSTTDWPLVVKGE